MSILTDPAAKAVQRARGRSAMQRGGNDAGERSPRVVVVGAGFAAVGVAKRLLQGGITDVTLLEARDRPGGRVQTVVLDKGFVELGGQFLHGETEIYETAKREGLLREESEDEDEEEEVPDTIIQYQTFTFRLPGGVALDQQTVNHNLKVLEELISRNKGTGITDVNVSLGEFLTSLYPEYMSRMVGDEQTKALMIKWLEEWIVLDSAARGEEQSLPGCARYVYEQGSGVRETRTGLWDVFQCLLHDALPQDRLVLNKPVKTVQWNRESAAGIVTPGINNNHQLPLNNQLTRKVGTLACTSADQESQELKYGRTENEDVSEQSFVGKPEAEMSPDSFKSPLSDFRVAVSCDDGEIFFADHVVVTSSVGFLKEHPEFFIPQLPEKHQNAVKSTGFGNVAKLFLIWDMDKDMAGGSSTKSEADIADEWRVRMLGSDVEGMNLLWPEGVQPEIKSARSSLRTAAGRNWYEYVCMMEFIDSYPFSLLVWVQGEAVNIMESLPLAEVKDVMSELLVLFLGKPDLPPPSRIIRSEWFSNPYTRGAYSYLATGVPLNLHDVISHPLPNSQVPVLQLAGEACSRDHYSTAHGALYSGHAAADVILRHHHLID
ncbi:hypothetical protein V1264_013921 [Littorina saxatilis]|uniref:Ig-like domain-containing protein n=2 Tax=Littorina saxatilis TaxID=31220 RepID=A0AAN9BP96_9CAEN